MKVRGKMHNPQASSSFQSISHLQQLSPASSSLQADGLSQKLPVPQTPTTAGPSTPSISQPSPASSSPEGYPVVSLKYRSEEELQLIQKAANGFAACLSADHAAVMHPNVDTSFLDAADVVNRLLPYHLFQQPHEDLRSSIQGKRYKGKEKAKYGDIRQEIEETRFALSCHKRLRKLQERFRKLQVRAGAHSSPDDQACVLAQAVLEVERAETAIVSSELRSARNELDATRREKRTASQPTVTTFRPTYYPQEYYRPYAYAYTQPYSASTQAPTTIYSGPPVMQPTLTSPTSASYAPSVGAIPVQLPVTSLSALHALGIVPVPAASLPPPDQPQPAAVLKGSTSNGTVVSLDINVSLLQSSQMSGLALLLNSLMSRGVSSGQANTAAAKDATQPAKEQKPTATT